MANDNSSKYMGWFKSNMFAILYIFIISVKAILESFDVNASMYTELGI